MVSNTDQDRSQDFVLHWMKLRIRDLRLTVGGCGALQLGALCGLMFAWWDKGALPDHPRLLARAAELKPKQWEDVREDVMFMFEQVLPQLQADREAALATLEKRRAAGRASGQARRTEHVSNTCSSSDEQIKITSKIKIQKEPKQKSGMNLERARARERGTRLPPDWQPSADDLTFARKSLAPDRVASEVEKFKDHWKASAQPTAVKRDWSAAWRTWCRKAYEFSKIRAGQGLPIPRTAREQLLDAMRDEARALEDAAGIARPSHAQ